ncbi:hypothetical protein ACOSQ2_018121 [Xanthoceras sorbifolium]
MLVWVESVRLMAVDGDLDGVKCAVDYGFGGGRNFTGDWFGNFRFHCFDSLLCCLLVQRQGRFLIHFPRLPFQVKERQPGKIACCKETES